jgi:hypothetical protein
MSQHGNHCCAAAASSAAAAAALVTMAGKPHASMTLLLPLLRLAAG